MNPSFIPCIVAKQLYTLFGAAVVNVIELETVATDTPKLLATVVANNFGVSVATVSSSAGVYSITFGTEAPNSVYSCFASIQGVTPGFISVQGSSTTLCRIYTFDKTGTASSSFALYFQIFAQ